MKKYDEPKLNVELMALEDVITTSSCADHCQDYGNDCPYAGPCPID